MERAQAKRATVGILAAGLGTAAVVYVTAKPVEDFPLGYDPMTNKKHILELERLGGKANVMTAEFLQWWGALWHGTNLAYTIAVLTIVVALGFWIVTTLPPLEDQGQP